MFKGKFGDDTFGIHPWGRVAGGEIKFTYTPHVLERPFVLLLKFLIFVGNRGICGNM